MVLVSYLASLLAAWQSCHHQPVVFWITIKLASPCRAVIHYTQSNFFWHWLLTMNTAPQHWSAANNAVVLLLIDFYVLPTTRLKLGCWIKPGPMQMFPGLRAAAAVTVVKCLNTGYLRSSYNDRLNAWSCNLDFRPDGKFNWIVSPSEDCEELLGFYPTPAPAIRACQPGAGAAISAVFTSSVLHIILCVLWLTPARGRERHDNMTAWHSSCRPYPLTSHI